MDAFEGQIALVYRHLPLTYHPRAYPAARAAVCAAKQNRFWDYHRALYASESLDNEDFTRIAQNIGLPDLAGFERCISDTGPVPEIEKDIAAATAMDAAGTPTFVVNGLVLGNVTPTTVRARIEELLNDR